LLQRVIYPVDGDVRVDALCAKSGQTVIPNQPLALWGNGSSSLRRAAGYPSIMRVSLSRRIAACHLRTLTNDMLERQNRDEPK